MSTREDILAALFTLISGVAGPAYQRNGVFPEFMGAGGLVILRDGDPGEPEVTLSPLTYIYEHDAVLECMIQNEATQDAALDAILVGIGQAIESDRTLGGLCDWIAAKAPEMTDLPVEGGEPIKGAVVSVTLIYGTTSPI